MFLIKDLDVDIDTKREEVRKERQITIILRGKVTYRERVAKMTFFKIYIGEFAFISLKSMFTVGLSFK